MMIWQGALLAEVFGASVVAVYALTTRFRQVESAPTVSVIRSATTTTAVEPPRSFRERILSPLLQGAGQTFLRLTPKGIENWMEIRLIQAGSTMAPVGALGVRALLLLVFLVPSLLLTPVQPKALLLAPMGLILPELHLRRKIAARRKAFLRDFPEVLDLLAAVAEAGLSFDAALQRVATKFPPPVGTEFSQVVRDLQVGFTREEALARMTMRMPIDETRTFIRGVIQGEQRGVGVAQTLRVLADDIAQKAYQRKEEAGGKLTIKIILASIFLLFPAFGLVLGAAMFVSFTGVTL